MDNDLDYIVKNILSDEVKELSNTEDIFHRIEEEIKTEVYKRSKDYKHYSLGLGFCYKKYISIAAFLLIVCTTLMFASSYKVRAFTTKAFSSIRTIFTVEIVDDKMQIVEKPTNEAYFFRSVSSSTQKSDKEISKKVGFTVRFPESIGDSFRLESKSLGVAFRKKVDYDTGSALEKDMHNAIEDDNVLKQLKPYDAVREASGMYIRRDQSTIAINVSKALKLSKFESQLKEHGNLQDYEIQKVKVGDLDGYWVKQPCPFHPLILKNGIWEADMSAQPEIKVIYTFFWGKSDITYTLITIKDFKLTLEESIKIAEDFMKVN